MDELRVRLAAVADPIRLLEEIFANAPVAFQILERSGRSVLVNKAHADLFGGEVPPNYNIFEDTLLPERGVIDLIKRAFAGERLATPPVSYDIRDLRNLPASADVSGGRT